MNRPTTSPALVEHNTAQRSNAPPTLQPSSARTDGAIVTNNGAPEFKITVERIGEAAR